MSKSEHNRCACGKQIPKRQNSTIKNKLCPACYILGIYNGLEADKIVKYELKAVMGTNTAPKVKKAVKRIKTLYPKNIDKLLDTAWSLAVKLKGGNQCAICGKTITLNSHHIFSRAKKSVRWYLPNGITLCVAHHIGFVFSAHKTGTEFTLWLIKHKGQKFLDDLAIQANMTSHWSSFEKQILLDEFNKEIKGL